MSMMDYDSRPVTPQVLLVGRRSSSVGYSIRDFLSRNGVPYEWVDVDDAARVEALLSAEEGGVDRLPVCVLPNGMRLAPATLEGVAAGLGMVSAPSLSEYDLTIVGAGPAGLAAAVYAASEGLRRGHRSCGAPGGQAGTTSMIENYLGFPAEANWQRGQPHKRGDSERRSFSLGVSRTSPRTARPIFPTVPLCDHGQCS